MKPPAPTNAPAPKPAPESTPPAGPVPEPGGVSGRTLIIGSVVALLLVIGAITGVVLQSQDTNTGIRPVVTPLPTRTQSQKPTERALGNPTQVSYLPNVTKAVDRQTVVALQNIGAATTDVEIEFYRLDADLVQKRSVKALQPGRTFYYDPLDDEGLPLGQFSATVKSYGASVLTVALQQTVTGNNVEATAYVGTTAGATRLFLPNVTRRYFGWKALIYIQNLGNAVSNTTLVFANVESGKTLKIERAVVAGRTSLINPELEAGLVDGSQYSLTVSADQPVTVLEELRSSDERFFKNSVVYSMRGVAAGSASLYGPYVPKSGDELGKGHGTVVLQNIGVDTNSVRLSFTPLGGGESVQFQGPSLAPGAAWDFDLRYKNGDTTLPLCKTAEDGCLGEGEYSFVATASKGQIAGVVGFNTLTSSDGYGSGGKSGNKLYLPLAFRTVGGTAGWSSDLILQSVNATKAKLSWYKISDGQLAIAQDVTLTPGASVRVETKTVLGLADNQRYALVIEGNGPMVGVMQHLNRRGGDGSATVEAVVGN